jgi:L-ascorbate metabolism protein UlaG (beta-lactamase superfamily)
VSASRGLRPACFRIRARPGSFLYDCHSRRFAPLGHRGACMATGFAPLYLAQAFGVSVDGWATFLDTCARELEELPPRARDDYVKARIPGFDFARAVDFALRVFPEAARFIQVTSDETAPFVLRDDYLFQPNVPLAVLEGKTPGSESDWVPLRDELDGSSGSWRGAVARVLGALYAQSPSGVAPSSEDASVLAALDRAGVVGPPLETHVPAPPPGVYLVGHSAVLIRTGRAGLLIDPLLSSPLIGEDDGFRPGELFPLADVVALTHGHFDHYHLPTLLGFAARPIVVPAVPRASVVCEDMAARLRDWTVADVRVPVWGETFEVGDAKVHVLPFVGEQFLSSELYPGARNWGNSYVVELDGLRVFVAADSGFEPGRSVIDVIASWVAQHGPVDVVLTQAIALRTAFGGGDPDLLLTALTCACRAADAVELLRPERRVTLDVEDLPALVRAAGARHLALYGQFVFGRAMPAVSPALVARARELLAEQAPGVVLRELRIGEGIGVGASPVSLT